MIPPSVSVVRTVVRTVVRAVVRTFIDRARPRAFLAASVALAGCLSGPALGGGAIGVAPDPRDAALLPIPDSTRGQSFVISSNRRDLMDETRTELNVSARAFERLLGMRPTPAEVRLTSTDTSTAA